MTAIAIVLVVSFASICVGVLRARSLAVVQSYRGPVLVHTPASWVTCEDEAPHAADALGTGACPLGIC